jgi:glycosyltransferase involved in cell wall biosynthesis
MLINPPRNEKLAWPWTEESVAGKPPKMACGQSWPKISVVTSSFNQGRFIEETIRSVLLQGYPNLEYFIIDGGSTDNTVEIIRKYEKHISYWVTEKDRGQCHAINKGFARATGDIFAWLCSDDVYAPGALHRVAENLGSKNLSMVVGASIITRGPDTLEGTLDRRQPSFADMAYNVKTFPQPSVFWNRDLWVKAGPLREDLYYVMDYDLWLKMVPAASSVKFIDDVLSYQRTHTNQKSANLLGPAHLFLRMRTEVALSAAIQRGEPKLGWVYRVWLQKFGKKKGIEKVRAMFAPGFHWQALRSGLFHFRKRTW